MPKITFRKIRQLDYYYLVGMFDGNQILGTILVNVDFWDFFVTSPIFEFGEQL